MIKRLKLIDPNIKYEIFVSFDGLFQTQEMQVYAKPIDF